MASRNFSAPMIIGWDGLTGTKNLSTTLPSQLLKAESITYEQGTVQKEPGAAKYNSAAIAGAPSIIGGWDWRPASGLQRMIVLTSAGALLRDTGGGTFGTTLASGLTVTDCVPVFVEGGKEAAAGNRKLFLFTGLNAVKVLSGDGVTVTNLSAPPTDWGSAFPTGGFLAYGRLWGYGNSNDPHRLYASLSTSHEDFTTAPLTFSIYPGEGDKIVCALPYKGLIIVWKYPTGIYYVDARDPLTSNWTVERMSTAFGTTGPRAPVVIDNDIIFPDASGNIQALSFAVEQGNLGSVSLSQARDMNPFIRETFNVQRTAFIRSVYHPSKRTIHMAWALASSTVNDGRLVIDLNRPDYPRFRTSMRDVCQDLWLRVDPDNTPKPVCGDNAGFVWLMDQSLRSKNGGYQAEFQTAHTDFGYVDRGFTTRRKNGQFLELIMEPKGHWFLSCDVLWDGALKHTVQFNMGSSGAALGSFTLGTDALGSDAVVNRRKKIWGSGRRLSIVGRNSGDGQDFSLASMIFHGTVGDERE